MTTEKAKQFFLPHLRGICNLPPSFNPFYEEGRAESSAWVASFNPFADRRRENFVNTSAQLLVAYTYPYAPLEKFRIVCDFVSLLFVIDEVSDEQTGEDARNTGEVHYDVLSGKQCDGSLVSKMTADFHKRLLQYIKPGVMERVLERCRGYIDAVAEEAELREQDRVLGVEEYRIARRENSAVRYVFAFCEFALGIELPSEVFNDETFVRAYNAAVDMVCWSNDVYSYNMEQAMGHTGNNVLTVLMKERGITLQEAADAVGQEFESLYRQFNADRDTLRSYGPHEMKDVVVYLDALDRWVDGNLKWSFASQRYFGPAHWEVEKTLTVMLKKPHRDA